MHLLSIISYICLLVVPAVANVEKTIFTAPDSVAFGDARPNLIDLQLVSLSSKKFAVRTVLPVVFPVEKHPRGLSSWYLLDGLRPGQRYEVRICWAATQPTDFILNPFEVTTVFDTPALLQDLTTYAEERQSLLAGEDFDGISEPTAIKRSALFLRIQSAANFYTTNKELMQHPPPVNVDIIFLRMQSTTVSLPRSFRQLPLELILMIIGPLAPDAFLSFGFANYHLLITHSLAPLLSPDTMTHLVRQSAALRTRTIGQSWIPVEVNLQILRNLEPLDALNYAMANYLVLAQQGIAPTLSLETLRRLNRAVQHEPNTVPDLEPGHSPKS
ncbi:hypothetical protein E4T47_02593 [Aureobasidium subglaciale]|nr:hypothetical protein E4T47_02593 [Aureobasidium subglaciale]